MMSSLKKGKEFKFTDLFAKKGPVLDSIFNKKAGSEMALPFLSLFDLREFNYRKSSISAIQIG